MTDTPPEDQHGPSGAAEINYQFLADYCADIVCSVGTDHVIHYASPSALEILDRGPGEMIGVVFDEFVSPGDISILGEARGARSVRVHRSAAETLDRFRPPLP